MARFDARTGIWGLDLRKYAPRCKGYEVPPGIDPKTLKGVICIFVRGLDNNVPNGCFLDSQGLHDVPNITLCPGRDDPKAAMENRIAQSQVLFEIQLRDRTSPGNSAQNP